MADGIDLTTVEKMGSAARVASLRFRHRGKGCAYWLLDQERFRSLCEHPARSLKISLVVLPSFLNWPAKERPMPRWVVILFVFLTLSNSSPAEERSKSSTAKEREALTELLKQLSDSIQKQAKENADNKMLLELMSRVSNTCQTPEGSCPLPSSAFKGTTC